MSKWEGGKGSLTRPTNIARFQEQYDRIFNTKKEDKMSIDAATPMEWDSVPRRGQEVANAEILRELEVGLIPFSETNKKGLKYDSGKTYAGLLVGVAQGLNKVAQVLTFGANKYCRNGWQSVPNAKERYTDAMWRHLLQEGVDEESGLPHLYHAACNMLFILSLENNDGRN